MSPSLSDPAEPAAKDRGWLEPALMRPPTPPALSAFMSSTSESSSSPVMRGGPPSLSLLSASLLSRRASLLAARLVVRVDGGDVYAAGFVVAHGRAIERACSECCAGDGTRS